MQANQILKRTVTWWTRLVNAVCLGSFLAFASTGCGSDTKQPTDRPAAQRNTGISYLHDVISDAPWSIHVVKVSRSQADLRLETTLGGGKSFGMNVVSEQVKSIPLELGRPIAAINGDFFRYSGKYADDPEGVQIVHGELVSAPRASHSCFWIDAKGQPHIAPVQSNFTVRLPDGSGAPFGLNQARDSDAVVLYTSAMGESTRTKGGTEIVLARGTNAHLFPLRVGETNTAIVQEIRTSGNTALTSSTMVLSVGPGISSQVAGLKPGDAVSISTATTPSMAGAQIAIGGGPALVHGHAVSYKSAGLQVRHPRTAIGWNKEFFFLVEVDGRQRESAGMTFPELADYMLKIGCDEALNLDGGGSATLWAYGNVLNSPSEGHERPAANALVVVRKNKP